MVVIVLSILGAVFVLNLKKDNFVEEKTVNLEYGVANPVAECKKICEDASGKTCFENFEICEQKIGVHDLMSCANYFRNNPKIYEEYPCIFFWSRQTAKGNDNAPCPCTFKCK